MRTPVFRNLDHSFTVLGFQVYELVFLCSLLVIGGEFADLTGLDRSWPFVLTLVAGATFFGIRRLFGEEFIARIVRFGLLPSVLYRKLFDFSENQSWNG